MIDYENTIDEISDQMRDGSIVLWIGAGFCISSGLPSGRALNEYLINKFITADKQNELRGMNDLGYTADCILYKNSDIQQNRRELVDYLKQIFIKDKAEGSLHNSLHSIPYIRDIVTTNYDNLFELVYNDEINVIYDNNTYANSSSDKINLFKIHGDFKSEDTIVLSNRDYINFISNTNNNMLASKIKDFFVSKSIVFLGFSFEDINISSLYKEISDLGITTNRKHYLITPNEEDHKINMLTSIGITYVNAKAEDFVGSLLEHTKEYLFTDIENEKIDYNRAKRVTVNDGFIPNIESDRGKINVTGITPTNDVDIHMHGVLSVSSKNEYQKFIDVISGKSIDTVELSSKSIKKLTMDVQGYKFKDFNKMLYLIIKPNPSYSSDTLIFDNKRLFPIEANIEIYETQYLWFIKAVHKYYSIEHRINLIENSWKFSWSYKCDNSSVYTVAKSIVEISDFFNLENPYIILPMNNLPFYLIPQEFCNYPDYIETKQKINLWSKLFNALLVIEKKFSIKFSNLDDLQLTKKVLNDICVLARVVSGQECYIEVERYIPLDEGNGESIIEIENPDIEEYYIMIDILNYKFRIHNLHLLDNKFRKIKKYKTIAGKKCYTYKYINKMAPVMLSAELVDDLKLSDD